MRGIVLSGGSGTRLYPVTKSINKQLLPIYDKPMVYYPLSVLMLAGIRDILIISTPHDLERFRELLGDGSDWGIALTYEKQEKPVGLADAFLIGRDFIGSESVCLILGDNIFYGQGFTPLLKRASKLKDGALVFGYQVKNPSNFGVVEFDKSMKVIGIEEKPDNPKSNYAVTGLYFYDNDVVNIAQTIKPSQRGEIEITSINHQYLKMKKLNVELLGRGFAWLDTGTHESLLDAGIFVKTIEERQGYKIACLEEIAYNNKWISKEEVWHLSNQIGNNGYGKYLKELIENE